MENKREYQENSYLNKMMLLGMGIVVGVLFLAYCIELVKGNRSIIYILIFDVFLLAPYIASILTYKSNPASKHVKYIGIFGYLVFFAFVMMTSTSVLNFAFIMPILVIMLVYQNLRLSLISGAISLAINLAYIVKYFIFDDVTNADIVDFEIQFFAILLVVACALITTRCLESIKKTQMSEIVVQRDDSANMYDMTMDACSALSEKISHLTMKSNQVSTSNENISETMDGIVEGTNSLTDTIQEQLSMTENITSLIEQSNSLQADIQRQFDNTVSITNASNAKVDDLSNNSKIITDSSVEVSDVIGELKEKINQINGILVLIQTIAEQTDMLSLNASIEAARVGDAGRGFAVVADEIKQLAGQTSEATEKINSMFEGIIDQTTVVTEKASNMINLTKKQASIVDDIKNAFKDIEDMTNSVNYNVTKQSESLKLMQDNNVTIINSVEGMSAFSEELLASIESTKQSIDAISEDTASISRLLDATSVDVKKITGQ